MGTDPFSSVAGHVALDFVNTLDNRFVPERTVDLLPTYTELLRFSEQTEMLRPVQVRELGRVANTPEAKEACRASGELRECLFRIFTGVARGLRAQGGDLAVLNEFVAEALAHREMRASGKTFEWVWTDLASDVRAPLWPIAFAAAELLVSEHLPYVRECGAETCRWLFLDLSKNHRRRWCDMKTCGNRVKVRRYYEKHASS